ncbi:MAG: hypothetical protein HXX16_17560 [Bacteroidales bacterium]|nr:hypothetical protein [Bacteroidales bacterium]
MDTFEQELPKNEIDARIELTNDSIYSLDTIWRWTSFFSIIGFIGIAFLILIGIVMVFALFAFDNGSMGTALKLAIILFYFVFGTVYFYPILLLFRFSTNTKKALRDRSSLDLSLAFKNLKLHFQYVGIMTIVVFALYILIIIGLIIVKTMI